MSEPLTPLGATTPEAAAALPYPADGGLKPQVRPFDETQSINDVLEAERIRQQQDPAHDQTAFPDPGRPVPPHGSGPAAFQRTPFLAFLTTDAADEPQRIEAPIASLKIAIAERDLPPPSLREPISIEGTLTTTFVDPILHRMLAFNETEFEARLMHGREVAIRELMWAAHNLIAHPLSEITHWLGYLIPPLRRFGLWLHDITIPQHAEGTGRG